MARAIPVQNRHSPQTRLGPADERFDFSLIQHGAEPATTNDSQAETTKQTSLGSALWTPIPSTSQSVRVSNCVSSTLTLRCPRYFRLPSKVLQNFYTCTIESILTGNTVWFGNYTKQDRQALQSLLHSAERITRTELPDLQAINYKRCQTKARRIVKDPTHPNNRLFSLLKSGKCFCSLKNNTERGASSRRPFGP
ncbi:hypothetical protein P4O66_003159 [Electrophorus voltai]|uniref:Uncharacterized protein n=1 Tax=Electrophorus voltai TaxID=2609070 RepID=A0AAD8YT10_9TELE|nr:hypothetical protein P4O66_003159 [Electrophorus voltai]